MAAQSTSVFWHSKVREPRQASPWPCDRAPGSELTVKWGKEKYTLELDADEVRRESGVKSLMCVCFEKGRRPLSKKNKAPCVHTQLLKRGHLTRNRPSLA